MAITPNTTFVSGAILTAAEQNNFPRGVMATASSSTSYVLTNSAVIATGMTVTFTAVASRNYRITYYEPEAQTNSGGGNTSTASIKITDAGGTQLTSGKILNSASGYNFTSPMTLVYVGTLTAGSITIVGTGQSSVVGGSFVRSATSQAQITVEDIGTA
jgi:hypothetical protein